MLFELSFEAETKRKKKKIHQRHTRCSLNPSKFSLPKNL